MGYAAAGDERQRCALLAQAVKGEEVHGAAEPSALVVCVRADRLEHRRL
jgi:hypothetical protein